MGFTDTPPPHVPSWLVLSSTATLGIGFGLWSLTYILMTKRSLETKSNGMPLLVLATNVSWEMVYLFYVSESPPESLGFAFWLVLDVGLVYGTIAFSHFEFDRAGAPWIGRRIGWILLAMTLLALWGQLAFAIWWLAEPGRGFGALSGNIAGKEGKWWRGEEGFDTTELAYWSAAFAQVIASAGCLAMLVERQHSGGTSYSIWFCRALGSVIGLPVTNGLLWWFWPEPHGYIFNPVSVFLVGLSVLCDAVYPFVLWHIRKTEVVLPNGRITSAHHAAVASMSRKRA